MSALVRVRFLKPVVFLMAVLVAVVAVLSLNLARPAQALGVSAISVSPNTMGATAQISFQVTNQSANTAEEIRVDFPANTFGVPPIIPATAVTVAGETVQSVAITGGTRVTINLAAPGISAGGTAAVTFAPAAGITNPTVPGNYTLSVSTEEEVTPFASADFSILGQVQNLTVTLTPSIAGAVDVTALLTFQVAQTTASGSIVSIGFPAELNGAALNEFTVPTTITPAQVQVRAGTNAVEAAIAQPLSPGGIALSDGDNIVTVAISLPLGVDTDTTPNLVEAGRFVSVRFLPAAGIDNPTVPGTSSLTVSTSVDTGAAQSSVTVTAVSSGADLALAKSDAPDPVAPGGSLTYTLSVTNNGPSSATNVTVTDTLPTGVAFVSAVGTGWTCSLSGLVLTCTRADLAVGAAPPITITVTTPSGVGSLSNSATVGATETDPNTTNNTTSATTAVQTISAEAADLAVTKSDVPDPVTLGNNLTYTITVTNKGPAQATGVTLTETLLGSFTLVSATPSQGSCSGTSPITCNLGNLASGASATVSIVVTPTTEGDIVNIAVAKGAEADSKLVNNFAIERTRVKVAKQEDTRSKIEFTGIVQRIPGPNGCRQEGISDGDTWLIQGLQVQVLQGVTEIKGTVTCGAFVKVEGALAPSGVVNAEEIKVDSKGRGKGHRSKDGDRPGFGLGDRNHTHFGPPGLDDEDDDDDDDHRDGKGKGGKDKDKGKGKGRGD